MLVLAAVLALGVFDVFISWSKVLVEVVALHHNMAARPNRLLSCSVMNGRLPRY